MTSAQQNYVTLQTTLESQRLQLETQVANARTLYGNAKRDFETFKALAAKNPPRRRQMKLRGRRRQWTRATSD